MSLLEDVFLEDETGEAHELERIIEGDDDERPAPASDEDSHDNSEKEDEAEEDKRRVDPTSTKTKRVSKNPRFLLNPARLTGPRGIQVIPDHFKDFRFKGKGHEKEDLDLVLKKLEHWAYRLYPKFQFEDCLKKIETLGKKRPVMVHLHKIRSDQYISDDVVVQNDSSDDDRPQLLPEEDEFDKLLQQQIDIARSTPGPNSAKKPGFGTLRVDPSSFSMPKVTSSPSISDEQKERMLRNRRLAEERRLARLKKAEQQNSITVINEIPIEVENFQNESNIKDRNNMAVVNDVPIDVETHQSEFNKKKNRSNIIDSSDDDYEELVVNESITVDVHDTRPIDEDITENNVIDAIETKKSSDGESINQVIDKNDSTVNKVIRKHNVLDCSDEDYEKITENPANNDDNSNDRSNPSENTTNVDEDISKIDVEKFNTVDCVLENDIGNDKVQSHFDEIIKDKQTDIDSKISENKKNETSVLNSECINKNNIEESKTSDSKVLKDKQNIDNNIELMDVDFDEDF